MNALETYYRILKHNREGKLIKDTGLIPSGSYVIQFLELIYSMMAPAYDNDAFPDKLATDTGGLESVINDVSDLIPTKGLADAGIGDDTHGIVVGTNAGATPEDNENYALDTKILHSGIGEAGKLSYQAGTFTIPAVVGANVDFNCTRTFLNETGSTITVKEIGLICKNSTDAKYHLLLRDVVADEDVLDGYTLTVTYTLRTTV